MPIVVNQGCTRVLKELKDSCVFWFAVGRTTAWLDEQNPPSEDATRTDIEEIQGFKKVERVAFVKPDPMGTISFKGQNYKVVPDTDVWAELPLYLYFSAWLLFDQFPVVTFRQTGLYVDVVPTPGSEGKDILLPDEVQSKRLVAYVNHHPRVRVSYGKDLLEMIVKLEGVLTSL